MIRIQTSKDVQRSIQNNCVLLLRKEMTKEKAKALQGIFRTPIKQRKVSTFNSEASESIVTSIPASNPPEE
jgi:hypothetical protein